MMSAKARKYRGKIIKTAILILLALILIVPIVAIVLTSFKTVTQSVYDKSSFLPDVWTLEGYAYIFGSSDAVSSDYNFFLSLFNSLHIALIASIGTVLSSSIVAFAFTRFDVKEKEGIFSFLMFSVMIPGQVLMLSMYELYVNLGWKDTFLPFWIPPFLGGGILNVFLIRQFFRGVPRTLFEAAEIDGASNFRIYSQIVLPLSVPILITVFIFTFTGNWNDFMTPLVYLTSREKFPLAYSLYNIYDGIYINKDLLGIGGERPWNIVGAACIMSALPIVILFFFTQKYFVESITVTGVKL